MEEGHLNLIVRVLGALTMIFLMLSPIFLGWRMQRRKDKKRAPDVARIDGIVAHPSALEKAEQQVADMDLREEYAKRNMFVVDHFYAIHGFTHGNMNELVLFLKEKDVYAETFFYERMPHGSVSVQNGCFDLYVEAESIAKAKELIRSYLNK